MTDETREPHLSALPSVDRVLADPGIAELAERCDRAILVDLVRSVLGEIRQALRDGGEAASREVQIDRVVQEVGHRLTAKLAPRLQRVINATGIVLHTNLGRAPLAPSAVAQVADTGSGYSDLEIDLEDGVRGRRDQLVEELLCELTGAEAATVVNNNAAAVLLTLNSLGLGREAVISRGQQIEIGGSFRLPDLMRRSGATMVEVGTTNRTHLSDYESAITEQTGLILVVNPSNYKVLGFTAAVPLDDLVQLGRRRGVPVAHDLGGGALFDLAEYGLPSEPVVSHSVAAGAAVVTFSGDKVLGGPQAGLLVGHRDAIEQIRSNPLMRALRCGKLTYAALEATLRLHLDRAALQTEHPVLEMLTVAPATLRRRARDLKRRLADLVAAGWRIEVVASCAQAGSGTLPLEAIPSVAVTVTPPDLSAGDLAARLRRHDPPVLGYVRDDTLNLDLRAVAADELRAVAAAVRSASQQ